MWTFSDDFSQEQQQKIRKALKYLESCVELCNDESATDTQSDASVGQDTTDEPKIKKIPKTILLPLVRTLQFKAMLCLRLADKEMSTFLDHVCQNTEGMESKHYWQMSAYATEPPFQCDNIAIQCLKRALALQYAQTAPNLTEVAKITRTIVALEGNGKETLEYFEKLLECATKEIKNGRRAKENMFEEKIHIKWLILKAWNNAVFEYNYVAYDFNSSSLEKLQLAHAWVRISSHLCQFYGFAENEKHMHLYIDESYRLIQRKYEEATQFQKYHENIEKNLDFKNIWDTPSIEMTGGNIAQPSTKKNSQDPTHKQITQPSANNDVVMINQNLT
ncbi:hypothetical protein RFI_00474 [Reticulomyxa filosa]|uniref:Uncharacterized protein n=1 Tax=Reticulomyxa filosa TaxID=46433 RepID=X6PEQ5_RETFI|nr:hypothetical protein RFI_00474 [Reticulomyxa filosa]|eukprot:ETO36588.1 hypothetical protein RFI_00474 [Reticulomyxa filosa]